MCGGAEMTDEERCRRIDAVVDHELEAISEIVGFHPLMAETYKEALKPASITRTPDVLSVLLACVEAINERVMRLESRVYNHD